MSVPAWPVLHAGLLRIGAGLRFKEIGMRLCCSESTARRSVELHAVLLGRDEAYMNTAARILHEAIQLEHRPPRAG